MITRLEVYLIAAACAVAALIGGWAYIVHLQKKAALAAPAVASAKMAEAETRVVEHFHEKTNTITLQGEAKADAIPPSDDLPADVHDAWLSGLNSVRDGSGSTVDHSTGKPAR